MRCLPLNLARFLPAVLIVLATAGNAQVALASGTTAAAGTVLVLPIGDASDVILLSNNAAAPLRDAGIGLATLEDAELVGFLLDETVKCLDEDGECEHLLRKAPAEWVLLLRIRHGNGIDAVHATDTSPEAGAPVAAPKGTGADEDQTVIAKLYAANDGSLLQVDQRLCKRCSSRERMAKLTMELIADVTRAELANQATETYINVSSSPANAILSIDGTVVGPTGQAYRVAPGEHTIAISLEGYRATSQQVTVGANENKAITVGLGKEGVTPAPGAVRRALTWASLGTGVVAMGAGIAWIAVDGNATAGDGGARAKIRDTMTLGVSSLIVGTLLVGTGVTLWLTEDDGAREMQVSAAPAKDGLTVGLSGRF